MSIFGCIILSTVFILITLFCFYLIPYDFLKGKIDKNGLTKEKTRLVKGYSAIIIFIAHLANEMYVFCSDVPAVVNRI